LKQYKKQSSEIVSADEGIQIDSSDVHIRNAHSPMVEILVPDSNAKFQRLLQDAKHDLEIVSMDEGMHRYPSGYWKPASELRIENRTTQPSMTPKHLGKSSDSCCK
jgi:hypothetical protein